MIYLGLNYQTAAALFQGRRRRGQKNRGFDRLMADLQVMELEALSVLNRRD